MEELFLGLAIIMTFSLLMFFYRLNLRLAHYPGQTPKQKAIVDKINGLGKYLALGGGLATLPVVVLLIFAPDTIAMEWVIYLAACGMVALITAVPMMIVALIWRTYLSPISMIAVIKVLFKTVQGMLQTHWRTLAVSLMAVTLLVLLLPVLKYVAYFSAWAVMGKLGLLNGNEGGYYKDDGFYTKGGSYNYSTDKYDNGLDPGGIYYE
jgi:hypothetical protein